MTERVSIQAMLDQAEARLTDATEAYRADTANDAARAEYKTAQAELQTLRSELRELRGGAQGVVVQDNLEEN